MKKHRVRGISPEPRAESLEEADRETGGSTEGGRKPGAAIGGGGG